MNGQVFAKIKPRGKSHRFTRFRVNFRQEKLKIAFIVFGFGFSFGYLLDQLL